jgi:hypothetical protein
MRVQPITQVYFNQHKPVGQPTRKEINVRAKAVEEKPDAIDRFEDTEPMCQRITRAVIIGALIFLATHILIWILR